MKVFLKVTLFAVLTIAFFAGFSNYGIPEIEPAPPPEQEQLDLGSMTMEGFIALGERLFTGRGTCTLCHNAVGGRAPLLDGAAAVAPERMADPRYRGSAGSVEEYLYESLVEPSAFVVAGFGKAGTDDTESPMPNAATGSIGFSEAELRAVVAYLQDTGGVDVTVEIPTDLGAEDAPEQAAEPQAAAGSAPRAPFGSAEEAMAALACTACHKVAGQGGELGPDLSRIGATRDADYLRRAILDPGAEVPEGFPPGIMPPTYGEQLYAGELEMLVGYLAGLR